MKTLLKFALILSALFCATAYAGGTWSNVTIVRLIPNSAIGYLEMQLSAPSTGTASCATANPTYVILDVSTEAGAISASILETVKFQGGTVSLYGTGACSVGNAQVETFSYAVY